ncbi:MAG TPA: hypothetical protein VFQ95_04325 [Rhodanobacteraceae bacterium]|nr:hypothetical protein [Rhodanobacteraceae bacterium]
MRIHKVLEKQYVMEDVVISRTWKQTLRGQELHGRGDTNLLFRRLTAFFASRTCPAPAIHAGLAWALEQVRLGATVIGGFHSPLERSVLNLLLEARSPAVVVLARDAASARLPSVWQAAIRRRHLTIVSDAVDISRLDSTRAAARNEAVVALSDCIVVAHIRLHGSLDAQVGIWERKGMRVDWLHKSQI